MSLPRYENYKDSGVEWIGEIPEGWEVKKLKRLAKILNGQDHKNVWDINGIYPIIGTGGVFGYANKSLHSGPSVLLGRKGTIDRPQYIETPFWSVDTAYFTDIAFETNPKYFYYICTTINFDLHKYGSAVPSMTQEVLNQIPFAVPSLSEQTAIASFLDRKTAEIDQLITNKEKLIALYEEEKTAIINRAVTRGLNPDVKTKPSGVDWLGDIPEHWEVKRLKYVTHEIITGKTPPSGNESYYNGDINWFTPGDFDEGILLKTSKRTISESAITDAGIKLFPAQSVLLVSIGATLGKIGLTINFGASNQQINAIVFDKSQVIPSYGLYFLCSVKEAILRLANSATLAIFNQSQTKDFEIFVPDPSEQTTIVTHIETEYSRLNAIIDKFKKQIDLFKEYRTTLISEVVTGKIDVRDEVAV